MKIQSETIPSETLQFYANIDKIQKLNGFSTAIFSDYLGNGFHHFLARGSDAGLVKVSFLVVLGAGVASRRHADRDAAVGSAPYRHLGPQLDVTRGPPT